MSMEFTMGAGGVPAGAYQAEFIGGEPWEENAEKYGVGVSSAAADSESKITTPIFEPFATIGEVMAWNPAVSWRTRKRVVAPEEQDSATADNTDSRIPPSNSAASGRPRDDSASTPNRRSKAGFT